MADPIFIAPHYDDVALSCGGTVATLAREAAPQIVTVFGGEPTGALSLFAEQMHSDWGLSASEVIAHRRREDRCASGTLGESVRSQWWDFLDAIYRDARYDSDERLFGTVLDEVDLVDDIAARLAGLGDGDFYIPLGIGNHVDHQVVFRAGLELARQGAAVYGYADLPYALNEAEFKRRLRELELPVARDVELDSDAEERRWEAVRCYASQWPVIFRDTPDPRGAFAEFGRKLGNGSYVDRFWRLSAAT